mmetsp:Transcript_11129/g.30355  ORF Transcript_11129/g.30355 Transcript_11129/m.30355 type:complete len:210 (+) Transcript_11129:420-1049(+)
MLRAQPPTELEIDFEGYICLDEYNRKYAEKLERPRAEAAGAASEAWVLGDSLARLRDAMLPRLTRVSLAGADRLPVAMLRVAFPLDGDGLAAPAPYDDGSGSLLSIDFAPGSPARDGIESYDYCDYPPSMYGGAGEDFVRGGRGEQFGEAAEVEPVAHVHSVRTKSPWRRAVRARVGVLEDVRGAARDGQCPVLRNKRAWGRVIRRKSL